MGGSRDFRPAAARRGGGALFGRRRSLQARPDPGGEGGDRPRAGDRRTDEAVALAGAAGQCPAGSFRQCRRRRGRPDDRCALDRRLAILVGVAQGPSRGRPADALPADHRAGDRCQRRAQLAVQAGCRRRPAEGRAGRRPASRGGQAAHRPGHAELHQSANQTDAQSRAGRGDGLGRLLAGAVVDCRHRHGERRAAVAGFQPWRTEAPGPRDRVQPAGVERQARLQGHCQRSQRQRRCEGPSRGVDRRADQLHRHRGSSDRTG